MEWIAWIIFGGVLVGAVAALYTYFNETTSSAEGLANALQLAAVKAEEKAKQALAEQEKIKRLSKEYSEGFPLLGEAYAEYFSLYDGRYAEYLETKSHPAQKSADLVRQLSKQKTDAIRDAKFYEYLNKYYETLAPFLVDAKGELLAEFEARQMLREYSEDERQDPVTLFASKEEYRKLSREERNQLTLDRYWDRRKSKATIGLLYERYVGYLLEKEAYEVEYHGIFRGFEDLGRDLIAKRGKEVVVVQCKNWSQFKNIYENHIFQFFGTVYRFKFDHPKSNVKAAFYTSTELSEVARSFAVDLGIDLKENFKLERYPCVKCNISRVNGEKIYHLPMDQQYDTTKIEPDRGEKYVMTVTDAENAGFRRAFRWRPEASA